MSICVCVCVSHLYFDRTAEERGRREKTGGDVRQILWEGGTSSLLVQSSPSFLSSVAVSGFKWGASWTPTQSLLLRVVIKVRQHQNIAFCFGSGRRGRGVTRGSLLLQRHDVLHQARDGGVDVGVILEGEGGDKAWEMDGSGRDPWSCQLHADLKHRYSCALAT